MLNINVAIKDQSKSKWKKGPQLRVLHFLLGQTVPLMLQTLSCHLWSINRNNILLRKGTTSLLQAAQKFELRLQEDIRSTPNCFLCTVRYLLNPHCSFLWKEFHEEVCRILQMGKLRHFGFATVKHHISPFSVLQLVYSLCCILGQTKDPKAQFQKMRDCLSQLLKQTLADLFSMLEYFYFPLYLLHCLLSSYLF